MQAYVRAIEYHLPDGCLSTEDLAAQFPEWSVQKIDEKTGIQQRRIAAPDECSSDLAVAAAQRLFASGACRPDEIDYLLLCTQSPDYFLPTTACLLQDRLGIPTTVGALDFNLGCSGFVYGLSLAQGLIAAGNAHNVLLLTAETYSKFVGERDRGVRTIFGDAAAATLVSATGDDQPAPLGPFIFGTDGRGGGNLIVSTGGMRRARTPESAQLEEDQSGNLRSADHLFMNGAEVFNFTLAVVPDCVQQLLVKSSTTIDSIDLFVFHQANKFMLEHLRRRMKIPAEKFFVSMAHCGNTVSSTIPIALKDAAGQGRLAPGATVMLVGFGVGYSWAATLLRWRC